MVSLFSKTYEDTLDPNCDAPDMIIKIGSEKHEYFCHRLILAAASDFLETVIETATPGTIPVILLPDVSVVVIEFVLKCIYYGEVQISAVHYADFVDTCKLLELKAPMDQVRQFDNIDEDEEVVHDLVEVYINDLSQIEVRNSELLKGEITEKEKLDPFTSEENESKKTKSSKFESKNTNN